MPIPDFQSLMLPLLQHFADGKEHTNQETLDTLAGLLQLTAAERGYSCCPAASKRSSPIGLPGRRVI